jgi:hypothetical protein
MEKVRILLLSTFYPTAAGASTVVPSVAIFASVFNTGGYEGGLS